MRARRWVFALSLSLTGLAASLPLARPACADFDPDGRGKKKPPKGPTGGQHPVAPPPAKPPSDKPEDGRSKEALIARYTGIVMAQPGAAFPIQRLTQLYRERDGNLAKLITEFEKRAGDSGEGSWPAKVALAGFYKAEGRYDDAIKTYEDAISDKPKEAAPLLALAQLKIDRGDTSGARGDEEKALPLLKDGAEIEQTTRVLMGLCLDLKDFDAAKTFHDALVARSQGSLFVKAELGRELLARNELERAETELRDVVKAASGDNRALAPALKDLGSVLTKEKKLDEAVATLKKALATAAQSSGVRAEIMAIMTEAFRSEGKLPELVAILEKEPGQDENRLATLGALYEETGDVDKAITTYRKTVAIDPSNVDVRLKLVHLLQTAGQLEDAVKEYEALVKAAPGNPDYVFELCETLIQRGDRPKALSLLKDLEGREAADGDVLATIADFYERVEEKDRAMALLQRLASATSGDPTFLVDLGDRYFQANDRKKALETWARVKLVIRDEGKADFTLGQVYLDHDMPDEALASLREAVNLEPANNNFKKSLAIALERTAPGSAAANDRFAEAVAIWQEILDKTSADTAGTKSDENLAREARTHIVSVWSVTKELAGKVAPLKARFESTPPDLEAGRLLAEVDRKLAKLADAEAVLRKLIAIAPGDEPAMLALERILVQQQNLSGAIDVLALLAERDTKSARQFYQRMAEYAAELYHDDDAIKYAAKAVELAPEDALGHQKLGDMYKKHQDVTNAIAQYRQAIQKNDRLFPVYFDLGELLLTSGSDDEADLLFRKVVRAAPDEELVSRAARMSMQINLGKGTLETLERDLLPVAVGNPHKTVYRRMLVELYGAMTLPLVEKIRQGGSDPKSLAEMDKARGELRAIGTRAVKPLLDALADDHESEQRIAIDVLAYVDNKSAGATLFNFATGAAEKALRVRAMIACGALRDDALLDRYSGLLVPKGDDPALLPNDDIAVAAAWGVARMRSDKAADVLVHLLGAPSPEVRSIAALGLGLSKNKKVTGDLLKMASSGESGPLARSAAIVALGELLSSDPTSREAAAVIELASQAAASPDVNLARAGLLTSARLLGAAKTGATGATVDTIAAALFSKEPAFRTAAVDAATLLVSKTSRRSHEPLPVPDGPLRAEDAISSLGADAPSIDDRVAAFVALEPAIARAGSAAVATSSERAATVAASLGNSILAPFAGDGETIPAPRARAATDAMNDLLDKVTPGFLSLVHHPDLEIRCRAIDVLGGHGGKAAEAALVEALSDPEDRVRRAALDALSRPTSTPSADAVRAIASLAKGATAEPKAEGNATLPWALRIEAAKALGEIGRHTEKAIAIEALGSLAKSDSYALVREAAVHGLASVDLEASRSLLTEVAKSDAEPRVRDAAATALAPSAPPPAGEPAGAPSGAR